MVTRPDFTVGQVLTAAELDTLVDYIDDGPALSTYTPALTATTSNPTRQTAGNGGSIDGTYKVVGGICYLWVMVVYGASGTSGDGVLVVSLPNTVDTSTDGVTNSSSAGVGSSVGSGVARDAGSSSNNHTFTVVLRSTTTVQFSPASGGAVLASGGVMTEEGDRLHFFAQYPVDLS